MMFFKFARWISRKTGHPLAFLLAVLSVLVWLAFGPFYNYSDTWQLVINTGTTIITFLMVFVIQNSQNRDTMAMQIKLNEIIRAMRGAHTRLVNIEELTDEEIEQLHKKYEALSLNVKRHIEEGKDDQGAPNIRIDK